MQTVSWYYHRLRAMAAGELAWRTVSAARDRVDRLRLRLGAYPDRDRTGHLIAELATPAPPRLCDVAAGAWRHLAPGAVEVGWRERLVAKAELAARHRLVVFGREYQLGSPIDWNRDVAHDRSAPRGFTGAIDYRDFTVTGDAKIVWEPNRHQHFAVLARAYRATGDRRYAGAIVDHLSSWLDQCPFGYGMNWRSPLELAIRLINWTYALDLIRDSGTLGPEFCGRVLHAVDLQVWDIARKYSKGSSANNHLIGEAAGVFVATSYFHGLPRAEQLRDESFRILCREIDAQTYADGGTREQAMAYHLFVLELLVLAALVGEATGRAFPPAYWSRLEAMIAFAAAFSEGGPLPAFGDSDDGYVLDLGERPGEARGWYCVGAALFGRGDFKARAGAFREPARWLLGERGLAEFDAIAASAPAPLQSRALPESGYYLLQCGGPEAADTISAVFDCGPLGFTSLAAHGHADALSLVIRAFGRELLVDPGTFDYFTHPDWREYFRGTRAHNTVTVDGHDQSVQLGGFLWGAKAQARCLDWRASEAGACVAGEHDGYRRLRDPVVHRRRVELHAAQRVLIVHDELSCDRPHTVEITFHFAEDCELVAPGVDGGAWQIHLGAHAVRLVPDSRLMLRVWRGSTQPIAGWVSRSYHERVPSTTLSGVVQIEGTTSLASRFEF